MEHTPTPTPWIEIANFFGVEKAKRIVECVNACVEFPDPKIDIGLLKLHAEQQTKLLASCEAALAERDKEIAKLNQQGVESLRLYQLVVNSLSERDVNIQALQDRVKELEDNNPISQIFSFEKPKTKEELADDWRESKTKDEWIALLKKHNHYGYDRGIILSELIEMWELETQTS
jgi:hypothetical protein